jgi:hypothetical protein
VVLKSVRASERSADASRRIANEAIVQQAIARVQFALQTDLASEQDQYVLDRADYDQLAADLGGSIVIHDANALRELPSKYRTTHGVWEHRADADGGNHRLGHVTTETLIPVVVEEASMRDGCEAAAPAADAPCAATTRSYWQVVRIVTPDTTGSIAPNVVVTIRSWEGDPVAGSYSNASYARVEFRPGRFADFQQISDGNVRIGAGATINGPIHSNGIGDGSFSTVQTAPRAVIGDAASWAYVEPGASCSENASVSVAEGVTVAPPTCRPVGATGQMISFLRAADSIGSIRRASAARRPGVGVYATPAGRGGDERRTEPYATAWEVEIRDDEMYVSFPDGSGGAVRSLGRSNAYVFDDDVRVRGRIGSGRRITIAAERADGGAATVFIDGDLTKGDQRTSSIGIITHGDVVLWMWADGEGATATSRCPVSEVEAAIVSVTGGLTIPPRYLSAERQDDVPTCSAPIRVSGSVAGHRPPTLVWSWGPLVAGYDGVRNYQWDRALQSNPPPYFPLTGAWQPVQVRNVNIDCLTYPRGIADPDCR